LRRALAVGIVIVAVAAGLVVALVRGADEPPAVLGVVTRTSLAPLAAQFGDAIQADVDVVLDPRAIDPDSVLVAVDFGPLDGPERAAPERIDAGASIRLRFRYRLLCLREDCRPREGRREVQLAPVLVRYHLADGATRRVRVDWPAPIVIGSRLTDTTSSRPVWRVREHPPPAISYRVPPTVAVTVGYSVAALLALAALVVLALETAALVGRRRRDPLTGLTPLERALALLARAVDDGGAAQQRRALDRLARELRRTGDTALAADARRLAWSRPRPERERIASLAAAAAAGRGGAA
jgi:hypothetical protein